MSFTSWIDDRIKTAETVALSQIETNIDAKIDDIAAKIEGLGTALDALPGLMETSVERIVNTAFADVTDATGKIEVDVDAIVTQVVAALKGFLGPLGGLIPGGG